MFDKITKSLREHADSEKHKRLSLTMPCAEILILLYLRNTGIEFYLFIPPVICILLDFFWRLSTFKYLGLQIGLNLVELLLVGTGLNDLFFDLHGWLYLLFFFAPAILNAVLYIILSKSRKITAALVLSDPAFIWALSWMIILIKYAP